jgi:hypothetical protein
MRFVLQSRVLLCVVRLLEPHIVLCNTGRTVSRIGA